MILVTGGGGKTAAAVMRSLAEHGERPRLLVRDERRAAALLEAGTGDVVVADLLDSAGMERACENVHAIYLIAPNVHPEEPRIGDIAISAAQCTGVERIVYHSVLHPQTLSMPHHRRKLAVERALFRSDLRWTILQPCAYMQNVLAYRDEIERDGAYRVPYGERGRLSLVDLDDVAQVAAAVLTEAGHEWATYELAGPAALTPADIAAALVRCLGRPVRAKSEAPSAWAERALASGVRPESVDSLVRMFRYYDTFGLTGSPRVLEWLLGRPPTDFDGFLARALGA